MVVQKNGELIIRAEQIIDEAYNRGKNDAKREISLSGEYERAYQIEELELSVRSYNCLMRAGLNTIGKVIEYDQNPKTSWLKVRNLGRKSIEEIRVRLFEFAGYEMEGV